MGTDTAEGGLRREDPELTSSRKQRIYSYTGNSFQGLQFRTVNGELDECAVGYQDAFFEIHLLQVMTIPS